MALGRTWASGASGLAGLASLALVGGLPVAIGAALLVGSSLVLVWIFQRIYLLRPESPTVLLLLSALAWLGGSALWLGGLAIVTVVPFDIVVAAQTWGWIDPITGPAKAAAVLRACGRLAAF